MQNSLDIVLLKLPNHNVDYPSLSIPTLTRALRNANCSVVQDDINAHLRDYLLTAQNLEHLTYRFLPEVGKYLMGVPSEYKRIKTILKYLKDLDSSVGFAALELTKNRLFAREYKTILDTPETSRLLSLVFIVESIFHNIIDLSLLCDDLALPLSIENVVVTYLEKKVNEIAALNPRIVAFSILDIQRTATMWFAKRLKPIFHGLLVVGGPDVSIYNQAYMEQYPYINAAFIKESEVSIVSYVSHSRYGIE